MSRKASIELSANFLVVIILSLVLFGAGMFIFTRILGSSTELELEMSQQMQQQLDAALDDGSLIIASPSRVTVDRGDTAGFNLAFKNEIYTTDFRVTVTSKDTAAIPQANVRYIGAYNAMAKFTKAHTLIAVNVPKTTNKGQYALDIKVEYKDTATSQFVQYDQLQRVYVIIN